MIYPKKQEGTLFENTTIKYSSYMCVIIIFHIIILSLVYINREFGIFSFLFIPNFLILFFNVMFIDLKIINHTNNNKIKKKLHKYYKIFITILISIFTVSFALFASILIINALEIRFFAIYLFVYLALPIIEILTILNIINMKFEMDCILELMDFHKLKFLSSTGNYILTFAEIVLIYFWFEDVIYNFKYHYSGGDSLYQGIFAYNSIIVLGLLSLLIIFYKLSKIKVKADNINRIEVFS